MAHTTAEQMLYTTFKVTGRKGDTDQCFGTGFFYNVDLGNEVSSPWLITNRHVVEGCDSVFLTCHIREGSPAQPSGKFVQCEMRLGPKGVIGHPDPGVDLCGISLAELFGKANATGKPIYFVCLRKNDIPDAEGWENFDAIEEVLMVGCPSGIYDETNNLPIVRRGITASSLTRKYNGKDIFLVDMACFPGSSGSPVFIYNRDGYFDRKANSYLLGKARLFLLGILFAGPLITNTGEIVLAVPPPRVLVPKMMHLGYVLRSTTLLTLEEQIRVRVRDEAA